MSWWYGGSGYGYDSPSYYYEPPYYAPPVYEPPPYYAPPVYEPPVYEPPPYFAPPPVYSPPPDYYDVGAPAPYFSPPDYSTPAYSPPPDYSAPAYSPPDYSSPDYYDYTPTSPAYDYSPDNPATPAWYEPYESPYSAPPAYESWSTPPPFEQYLIDSGNVSGSDPYGLLSGDGDAYNQMTDSRSSAMEDVYSRLNASIAAGGADAADFAPDGFFGATGDNYYGGSDVSDTNYFSNPAGSDSNYFSSPTTDTNYFSSPTTDSNYFTPSDTSGIAGLPGGTQFASLQSNTMSDAGDDSVLSSLGNQTRSLSSEGGSNSGAGMTMNGDGSSTITTANGQSIDLSDADTQSLLRGDVTLAELAAQDTTERLSPTTVTSKDELTLEQPGPAATYVNNEDPASRGSNYVPQVYAQGSDGVPSLPVTGDNTFKPEFYEKDPDAPFGRNPETGRPYAADPNVAQAEWDAAQRENPEITPMPRQRSEDIANFLTENAKPGEPDAIEFMNAANEWTGNKADNIGTVAQSLQISGLTEQEISKELQSMYGIDKYAADHAANLAAIGQDRAAISKSLNEMGYGPNFQGEGKYRPGTTGAAANATPGGIKPQISAKGGSGGGGGGGGQPKQQQQQQKQQQKSSGVGNAALLAALAAMVAGNKGSSGGGGTAGIAGLGLDRVRNTLDNTGRRAGSNVQQHFTGGLKKMAGGGIAGLPSPLGGYSDGGRLLKGPGDGVSDSIPATIGKKQPARLADGEFVVPARIVSELGNGSTEAGARRLYEMMDRIQRDRKKSVGKGKVAVNSRAHKHLPA